MDRQHTMRSFMTRASVIPVLAIDRKEHALPIARALFDGGLSVIEVTLRTPAALAAVEQIATQLPAVSVGVGTCTRPEQLQAAEAAGAQFLVSPGLTDGLIEAACNLQIPLLPGVSTASELMRAADAGYQHLKFFPAESSGGVAALRAFSGPFPDVCFCPTGGLHPGNLKDYLGLANVLCVGGSWLAPQAVVEAGDWPRITALAEAVASARDEV